MFVTRTNSLLAQLLTLKVSCTKAHLCPMLQLWDEKEDLTNGEEVLLRPKWENVDKFFTHELEFA